MKIQRRSIVALFAVGAVLPLSGCFNKKIDFSVDNPTDAVLSVRIDDTAYDIKPHTAQDVSLPAGRHTIDSPAIGKLNFIVYAGSKGGLINPSLNPYVKVSEIYAVNDAAAKSFRPGTAVVHLDGVPFPGPYSLIEGLFIDTDWRYGVHEDFPESIRGSATMNGNIATKLFAKRAFIAYFETTQELSGHYARYRSPMPTQPPARPTAEVVPLPVFADPAVENASAKLKALYAAYVKTDKPDEQEALRKQYHQLTMDFVKVQAERGGKAPREENEKYNTMVHLVGHALGTSARVVP
ncbi:MAG: hypothetical protein RLZZ618_2922 [Pseudomonadota bacterium]|jgi:hypothetical protein